MGKLHEMALRLEQLEKLKVKVDALEALAEDELTNAVVVLNGETINITDCAKEVVLHTWQIIESRIRSLKECIIDTTKYR